MSTQSWTGHGARIALALAAVYLIWGSSFLATKVLVTHEPPLLAAGLRFMLAGLLLGAFAWWKHGPPRLSRLELRHVLAVMAGSIVVSNGCNVLGMQHVASNISALLNTTPALWIAWLGTLGRRATPLGPPARVGLAAGLAGVVLVLVPGGDGVPGSALGWQLVILLGCVGWSLATIYFRNAEIANPPTMFLALQMSSGGAVLLACAAATGEPFAMNWTLPGTGAFLWLTLLSSCVAYSAYAFLAKHATPVVVGSYAFVNPLIATLLGWWVLDEVLRPVQLLGMAVVLIGVALASGYLGAGLTRLRRAVR